LVARVASPRDLCDDRASATRQYQQANTMRRWIAALALMLAACAVPAQRPLDPDVSGAAVASKPAPACEPDPYCYRDCLRGYQPGYCRYKCGCQ
jgi:hypothetical protein